MNAKLLSAEDRIRFELKSLYAAYGFEEYKLPEFEDFVPSQGAEERILLNAGGRLCALKSDVTLSMVKNLAVSEGARKLFYDEKVYRKRPYGPGFSEVSQLGAEVMGDVDEVGETEICKLMTKTLSAAGGKYSLDVSHAGIVAKVIDNMGLTGAEYGFAAQCLKDKNLHDFIRFSEQRRVGKDASSVFLQLTDMPDKTDEALKRLKKISESLDISEETEELERICGLCGDCACINFSAAGAEYYNGVIFKGYAEGNPRAVLYGGRYDKLFGAFGKRAHAMGFALYLGEICKRAQPEGLRDVKIIRYDARTASEAIEKAEKLRALGNKVLLVRGEELRD